MFHLQYNRIRGFFDWSELRCLCRALGFQPDLIAINLPKEVDQTEEGMSIKDILRIINLKYLDLAVDKTFNSHTADWNLCVFKKAFALLDHRVLSYEELHDIRVAFCAYEHQDLKGMEIDENTIIRCLKMCGRIIAPLKMHHRIKHMSQMFDEDGRIQLYEFLDLILWTELYDAHKPSESTVTNRKKEGSDIYQVEDFQQIIQHYDERLAQSLNDLYLHEEWSFGKEEFSKQKLPNELPVNRDFRLHNMMRSNKHYRHLKDHVGNSQKTVHLTSTGHVRPRPLTAPNLEKYDQSEKSSIYTANSQHKLNVADMIRDYIHPPARFTRSASSRLKSVTPAPVMTLQHHYIPVSPAVTSEEKKQREHDLQSLKFHISTLDNRYDQKLKMDMEEQLPNYVPKPKLPEEEVFEEEPPKLQKVPINPALLPEHIDKLAYAPYRPLPKPSHAQKCDARYRGWHKVKTTKGPHYVLTTTSFSTSPNARLHSQVNKEFNRVVKTVKGDCVIRRTTSENVRPEITRPSMPIPAKIPQFLESVPSKSSEPPVQTPKTHKSSGRLQHSALDTIREGVESRNTSAGPSIAASTNKTYSFGDFNLYSEEYDKPEEKAEADAKNLKDTPATDELLSKKPITARRYSQLSGDTIAKEIVNEVDSREHSLEYRVGKMQKMRNLVQRRNLSGYARKRLMASTIHQVRAVSAS